MIFHATRRARLLAIAVVLSLSVVPLVLAQDRDKDDHRVTHLDPGTLIAVRTNEGIDADKGNNRVYTGIVDQDVRGSNGRLAIPRGAQVELIVRVQQDNDLIIDLDSVSVSGNRYALKTEANRRQSRPDDSLVGAIVGAIQGGQSRGRAVHIPRDSVLTFRLRRPLEMGVADRGIDRDGHHYHDYDDRR